MSADLIGIAAAINEASRRHNLAVLERIRGQVGRDDVEGWNALTAVIWDYQATVSAHLATDGGKTDV